jgi:protein-tyrosine phosphatase
LIDLHLHFLHETDDGAPHLDEAVGMVRAALADGCEALIATPHQRRDEWSTSDPALLAGRLAEVRERAGEGMDLRLGAELRVDSELLADLEAPERSGVLTLAGSRYLLLELEPEGAGPDPVELAAELVARGFRPIFAHPEFVPFLWDEEASWFPRLAEAGASFQVTAMSVAGDFGRGPREAVWRLLEGGFVQFVASDAHRVAWRPPGLSRARAALVRGLGEGAAEALTRDNPRAVLDDRPLAATAPARPARRAVP